MDGNYRWGSQRGGDWRRGHEAGAEALRRVVGYCRQDGVKALTVSNCKSAHVWAGIGCDAARPLRPMMMDAWPLPYGFAVPTGYGHVVGYCRQVGVRALARRGLQKVEDTCSVVVHCVTAAWGFACGGLLATAARTQSER